MSRLSEIQQKLNVPKNKFNKFGGYNYRSAEDILAGLKPLLGDAELVITDECVELCGRVYVKATANLTAGDKTWSATGWAKETQNRKGMDDPQLTGCASSYARKYALQALLLLDNESDTDAMAPPAQCPPPQGSAQGQGPTPWDQPGQAGQSPPPHNPPAQAPPKQPSTGKLPAPNKVQRKFCTILWDYFQTQSPTKLPETSKAKLLQLCLMHFNRYPGSVDDVEQAKKWINVRELQ